MPSQMEQDPARLAVAKQKTTTSTSQVGLSATQQQGGTLPPNPTPTSSQPLGTQASSPYQAPASSHLYEPSGPSPYTTEPIPVSQIPEAPPQIQPAPQPEVQPTPQPEVSPYQAPASSHLYESTGPSPYTTEPIPVSQIPTPPEPEVQPNPVPAAPGTQQIGPYQNIGTITAEVTKPANLYAPTGPSPYAETLRQETTYYITPPPKESLQPNPQPNTPLTPAPSEQYSDTTGFSKLTPQKSGIPSPEYFTYKNLTPEGQAIVRQGALNEALSLAGPVAFVVAPEAAVTGAVLGPVISQGMKAFQGQGLLTPTETIQSVYGGAVFSVVGAGAIGGAGLTGVKGFVPALARIGINTGIGAGGGALYEYAQTGKVTTQGPLEGAAFGAAFGIAGEVVTQGIPKVQQRLQPRVQESIDASYMKAVQENRIWEPTFKENVSMKIANVRPKELAPSFIESKTIPTTKEYDTYVKPATEEFQDNLLITKVSEQAKKPYTELPHSTLDQLYPITMKTEVIDNIGFTNERVVNKTYLQPKELEPNSFKGLLESNLKEVTLKNAELLDTTTTFIGKSESPETYYSKIQKPTVQPELPEYTPKLVEYKNPPGLKIPKLGEAYTEVNPETLVAKPSTLHGTGLFTTENIEPGTALPVPKTGKGFNWSKEPNIAYSPEEGKFVTLKPIRSGEELTLPRYEAGNNFELIRVEQPSSKLSFNKANEPVTWKEMVPRESLESTKTELPTLSLKDIEELRQLYPRSETPEKAPTIIKNQPEYWEYDNQGNFRGVSNGRVSKIYDMNYKQSNNPLIQELTAGQKAEATGIEKTVSDIQTGRTVETARSSVIVKTVNPFTTVVGKTFYQQSQRQTEETETIYFNAPESGLPHPPQPKFIVEPVQKQDQTIFSSQQNLFQQQPLPEVRTSQPNIFREQTSQIGLTELLKPTTKTIPDLLTPNNAQTNMFDIDTAQTQNPFQDFRVIPTEGITPIQITRVTPITTPKTPLAPYTPLIPKSTTPFIPIGGKYEGGGYTLNPFKIGGLESRKRVYPIFSGAEVLKL